MDQTNLLEYMVKCNVKSKPKPKKGKYEEIITFDSVNALYEGQELTLNAFRSGIFPIKSAQGKGHSSELARVAKVFDCTGLKILSPKEMIQWLPITLAQVKAGNTSENLLNKINQNIYCLYREKEVTKQV